MFYKGMHFIFFDVETTGITANGDGNDDYPIELAMILTDENLVFKDYLQAFINWPWINYYNFIDWPSVYRDAYHIHKIELQTIKQFGFSPESIVAKIRNLLTHNISADNNNRPTLVSDNAYFDTLMLHKLFNESSQANKFLELFHYTSWDINILYKAAGVEKASEHNHNALGDAANMWHRTLRSLEKIKYFD